MRRGSAFARSWLLPAVVPALISVAIGFGVRPATAADKTVRIATGNVYLPQQVYIFVGDSVTWTYSDGNGNSHSVTRADSPESFDSSPRCNPLLQTNCMDAPGQSFTHTFSTAGDFVYHCKVHGTAMTGYVHVKMQPATASPSPTATKTKTSSPSASPSPSPSPSPSASPSPSPGSTTLASGSTSDGSGGGTKVAVAVILVTALAGAGVWVWRRYISLR